LTNKMSNTRITATVVPVENSSRNQLAFSARPSARFSSSE
jgi:hypothetical protein